MPRPDKDPFRRVFMSRNLAIKVLNDVVTSTIKDFLISSGSDGVLEQLSDKTTINFEPEIENSMSTALNILKMLDT